MESPIFSKRLYLSSSFQPSILLIFRPITTGNLYRLFRFVGLNGRQQPNTTNRIFLYVFLRDHHRHVHLIHLRVSHPLQQVDPRLFFCIMTSLIFPNMPFGQTSPTKRFGNINAKIFVNRPLRTIAPSLQNNTFLLRLLGRNNGHHARGPPKRLYHLCKSQCNPLFRVFLR